MCSFLDDLEKCLSGSGRGVLSCNKRSGEHGQCDYVVHVSGQDHCAADTLRRVQLCLDAAGIGAGFAAECSYDEIRQLVAFKLNRSLVFTLCVDQFMARSCLDDFKIFNYKCKICCDAGQTEDMTWLRACRLCDILQNAVSLLSRPDSRDTLELRVRVTRDHRDSDRVIVVGAVDTKLPHPVQPLHYLRLRREEILSMSCHKLDTNPEFGSVDELVEMSVTYDLLHTSIHKQLCLNLNQLDSTGRLVSSSKGALFVVYNYVRLSLLLSSFDCKVSSGVYPPLPAPSQVDFGLLKLQEEWTLAFDCMLDWPRVLRRSLQEVDRGRVRLHLVFTFLSRLAASFSLYYHRTRILVEPREHSIGQVHARIYLLSALMQVYRHAFKLLKINPPSVM